MPPHDFWKWLRKEGRIIWLVVSFIPLLGFSTKEIIPSVKEFIGHHHGAFELAVQLLHSSIILIVTLMIHRYPAFINTRAYPQASERIAAFRLDWIVLWIGLFCFYAVLSLRAASRVFNVAVEDNTSEGYWFFAQNILINFSTVFFFFCYLNLAEPSGPDEHDISRKARLRLLPIKEKRSYIWLLFVVITFANLLCTLGLSKHHGVRVVFMLTCGLAAGVGLALLAGRFESRYINAPRFVLAALYIYAVNQVLYGFFDVQTFSEAGDLRPYISLLVLPLKLILFAFVSWLMKEGRLLFYLAKVPDLDIQIKVEWEQFKVNVDLNNEAETMSPDELQEVIRKRAHQIYEENGRREGFAYQDWLQAEAEILGSRALRAAA